MVVRFPNVYRALMLMSIAAISSFPQQCPAQAVPAGPPSPSRFELFGSYGYLRPVNSFIDKQPYTPLVGGGIGGVTGYFSQSFGIDAEYALFPDKPDYCYSTLQAGPTLRFNLGRLVPFLHIIGGGVQLGPSYAHSGSANPCVWGWGGAAGGGIDYVLPGFHNHLSIRPIAVDFQFTRVDFSSQSPIGGFSGGVGQIYAPRLSAGFVIRLGRMTEDEPMATISPASVPGGAQISSGPQGPPVLSANYVIGADDSIAVTVWQEPNLSATLPVRPDGKISLALVGDVMAAGFTPMQLAADITERLKKFVTDPVVDVTVQAVNSNRIFLIGEVGRVGPLAISPGMTVLQAIAVAGGLTPFANQKKIYILRAGAGKQQEIHFDYPRALKTGDMRGVSLQPGDTIVVP